jgi:hypothetical protein
MRALAEEIFKRISAAAEKAEQQFIHRVDTVNHSHTEPESVSRTEQQKIILRQLDHALQSWDTKNFSEVIRTAKKEYGFTHEEVNTLLRDEALVDRFATKLATQNVRSHIFAIQIGEWGKAGFPVAVLKNNQKIIAALEASTIEYDINMNRPDLFLICVEDWKKQGFDISKAIFKPEVIAKFNGRISRMIADNRPEDFLHFARGWEATGLDMKALLNSPQINYFFKKCIAQAIESAPFKFNSKAQQRIR